MLCMPAMMMPALLLLLAKLGAAAALTIFALLLTAPWVLAGLAALRDHLLLLGRRRRRQDKDNDDDESDEYDDNGSLTLQEALSVLRLFRGRVWHARYRPVRHEFTYPVFLFEVDLSLLHRLLSRRRRRGRKRRRLHKVRGGDDDDDDASCRSDEYDRALYDAMWPLSILVQFRSEDHLKNGEGAPTGDGREQEEGGQQPAAAPDLAPPLLLRVQNMLRQQEEQRRTTSNAAATGDAAADDDDWDLVGADSDEGGRIACCRTSRYRVGLVTNLAYYGYCFNPVSYYLIFRRAAKEVDDDDVQQHQRRRRRLEEDDRSALEEDVRSAAPPLPRDEEEKIRAVVGEVSNTPWGEMHCYVLKPSGGGCCRDDQKQARQKDGNGEGDDTSETTGPVSPSPSPSTSSYARYVFPKTFHVSPFMEMHYDYDWSFRYSCDVKKRQGTAAAFAATTMDIHNSLVIREEAGGDDDGGSSGPDRPPRMRPRPLPRQFHARLLVRSRACPTTVWSIACQLSRYPVYGIIVQLWIHYQALLLFFVKRVEFQPHPAGSETWASRAIGTFMSPFFALRALWEREGLAPSGTRPDGSDKKKQ